MRPVNPLLFYPWRVLDSLRRASQWTRLILRYRRLQRAVKADPSYARYIDAALRPLSPENPDQFVSDFADKILPTYGAPTRRRGEAPAPSAQGRNAVATHTKQPAQAPAATSS